jgi:exonuclease III
MKHKTLRLISWNVNSRSAQADQVKALASRRPDIVALQEVTAKTRTGLQDGLRRIGLKYTQDSFCLAPQGVSLKGPRRYGEIIASRWPIIPLPPSDFDWPERVLSVVVETPWREIEVHTAHIPCGASHEW